MAKGHHAKPAKRTRTAASQRLRKARKTVKPKANVGPKRRGMRFA